MANTVANSVQGNTCFTLGGSAITAATQPNLAKMVLANVPATSLNSTRFSGFISGPTITTYTGYDDASVILGSVNTLRGSGSNTLLLSPGAETVQARRPILKMEAARTRKVASAVASGFWHETSGIFTTTIATSNDLSTFGQDDEAFSNRAAPGAFAFANGAVPKQSGYRARTS